MTTFREYLHDGRKMIQKSVRALGNDLFNRDRMWAWA